MTVQSYYTKMSLATAVGSYIRSHFWPHHVRLLDLCAGSGNLSEGFLQQLSKQDTITGIHYVEPNETPLSDLKNRAQRRQGHIFHMTAEEYALTYAEEKSFDLILCNPPFGERIGRTHLNELVQELHLPELNRFESYFFTIASVLGTGTLVFLVPDAYFRNDEAESTLVAMAHRGWNLEDVRALPIDGYENALVNTSLWLLKKQDFVNDWVPEALRQVRTGTIPPLFTGQEVVTVHGQHGPVTGYKLPKPRKAEDPNPLDTQQYFVREIAFTPDPNEVFPWHPIAQPLGTLWERMGCMYELTANGWEPACSQGYSDGKPVSAEFDHAKTAYWLLRNGAYHTAMALVANLDVDGLKKAYSHLTSASFLHVLRKGTVHTDFLERDLRVLGILAIPEEEQLPGEIPDTVKRLGTHLYLPEALQLHHLCTLFLTYPTQFPPELSDRLDQELRKHQIPGGKISLRSPWIPKDLIGKYLDLTIDADGYFRKKSRYDADEQKMLAGYLNYGKGPYRICEGDVEYVDLISKNFAVEMNDWNNTKHRELRTQVHAHYIVAHAEKTLVSERTQNLNTSRDLHWWQTEDLPFALSGQTILSWDVGLGKTLGGIAAAVAHPGKALITVPKPVISKWAREITMFFPSVKFRVLGFQKDRFGKYQGSTKLLKSQVTEYFFDPTVDIILTTHQMMRRLVVSKTEQVKADEEDAYALVGDSSKETQKKARERSIRHAATRNYLFGGEFTFSDLPLATMLVIVDEGHQFKSLFPMPSAGWGQALVMAGSCGMSKRSRDLKIKLDLVRDAGGKTLCLTATPVSNSVAEIFNMLRVFAPSVLERRNIRNTQQFIDTFCILESITAVSTTGKVVTGQTITGFRNVDDLAAMWSECMITRTAVDVGLPLPAARETVLRIPPSPHMKAWMDTQKELIGQLITKESGEEKEVHIFEVISALDHLASYSPALGFPENPKGNRLVQEVTQRYFGTRGGQLIFSDRVESHDGLKEMLMEAGVEGNHIKIMNASTAPGIDDRLKIQDDYNSGKYRIIIGGAVASEGIDLQKGTVAIHFNSLAWEGQAIHQRKGRAIRQGNKEKEVEVIYYLLEGSTDIYRYATIQNKTHWWSHLRTAQTSTVTENVFCEPISDELIASLAFDPEETLARLRELRKEKEIGQEIKTYKATLSRILYFLNPSTRQASQGVLRELEKKLRTLKWIPEKIIDESIVRMQRVAHLLERKGCGSTKDLKWSNFKYHFEAMANSDEVSGRCFQVLDVFRLKEDPETGEIRHWNSWDVLVSPEWNHNIPAFSPGFGSETVARHQEQKQQSSQARLVLVGEVRDEKLPGVHVSNEPEKIVPTPRPSEPVAQKPAKSRTKKPSHQKTTGIQVQLVLFNLEELQKPDGKPSKDSGQKEQKESTTTKPKPQVAVQMCLFPELEATA